jgi:ubiquinone biosynthesis protein UbiJ
MPTPSLLCAAVEVALNRYLRLEPAALEACAALEGRSIALRAEELDWTLVIEPIAAGVRVVAEAAGTPDVTVTAPTARLLGFALRAAGGERGLPPGLRIEGDAELLDRFGRIVLGIGFDFEELLARVVGDGAAYRVAGGLRDLFGWSRRAADRLAFDTAEYLREETGDLASAADAEEWMDAVDRLRDGVDRFEARLARLERRFGGRMAGDAA